MYFFLLSQIGMAQQAYARPRRCLIGTKYMLDSFVRGCVPYLVSLETSILDYRSYSLFLISGQKLHFIVGYLLESSYSLIYHWQQHTP